MTRNYYKILGIDQKATQEQIKSAYKKLALKWHPDRVGQAGHLAQSKEEAEIKFKELNKAYSVLSDTRSREVYDLYSEEISNLASYENFGDDNSSAIDKEKEARKKLYTDEMKILSQYIAILDISNEFSTHFLQVEEKDLDASLWNPYPNWRKKAWSLEGEELEVFKAKMISAIQAKAKENKSTELDETKQSIIAAIERSLQRWSVKEEELEPHNRNFRQEISNSKADIKGLIDIEERVKNDIWKKSSSNRQSDKRTDVGTGEVQGPKVYPSRGVEERQEQQFQQEQRWFPFWGRQK